MSPVQAFPPLPSIFYGLVSFDGGNLPDGTLVEAIINGQVFARTMSQIYDGMSTYQLIVPGDDPGTDIVEGGVQGDIIHFKCNGILADQTEIWQSGGNSNLELIFSVDDDLSLTTTPTPASTTPSTSVPTQTQNEPHDTPTPKITQSSTIDNIFTATPTPGGIILPTGVDTAEVLTPSISSTSQLSPTGEPPSYQDQISTDKVVSEVQMTKTNTPGPINPSAVVKNDKADIGLILGIASFLLIGSALGIRYLKGKSRSNGLL